VSSRELVVLGTASQVPTRYRNHNGYLLLWDGVGVLFDPGEGTQRQMILADVAPSAIDTICLTHLHGDHCLGLPGVLQRVSLDSARPGIDLYYPASGAPYVERLRNASISSRRIEVREHPVDGAGVVQPGPPFSLHCAPLFHSVDTLGWRLDEPAGRRMLPERLAALGIAGPDIGQLARDGYLDRPRGRVTLDEVSVHRPGQSFAFIMDTGWCDEAVELAAGVDLLVCESTFLSGDEELARAYRHMTARDAGRLAAVAGARRLVLSHFSQRYPDGQRFRDEAAEVFDDVVVANDLDRIPVPSRE
jgi:ribonuclease Z